MSIVEEYKTETRSLIKDVQQLAVYSGMSYAEVMYMSLEERIVLSEVVREKLDLDMKMKGMTVKKQEML